ncbi:M20 family metallopeptidase [Mangrovibacter phragmitis]|uniref:M20 family metallopeptidase n=1 Tax=Mangrovibacter phragmitis TaxID=1691903 RepID=UPI0035173308
MDMSHYTRLLSQLVNIDCGTQTPQGVATVASRLCALWQEAGWFTRTVELDDACGPGLLVTNRHEAAHYDVLLIGHMDTVFPPGTVAQRPMSEDETRIYGPGVSDMKAGLLNIFFALNNLTKTDNERLSIAVAMNPDEEVGSPWSQQWLSELASRARVVLVCEAARADGSLVKARKGVATWEIHFSGVAAHAGNEPEKGRSAITALAHTVLAVNQLASLDAGTTVNVGIISGGDAPNIVAAHASATVDIRFWENSDYERVKEALFTLCSKPGYNGVALSAHCLAHKPAMTPGKATGALMHHIEQAGERCGVPITWQAVGGGSDANLTAALGIPTVDGLGPVGGGFHSPDEYLEKASVAPRIALLGEIISGLPCSEDIVENTNN